VTLTLEKARICQTADGEPVVFPSQLTAYLEQRDQHREARINLSRDGSYLPLAEARGVDDSPGQGPPRGGQVLVEPTARQIKTMFRPVETGRGIARWYAHRQSTARTGLDWPLAAERQSRDAQYSATACPGGQPWR
jgi:hypothetical protein